MWCNLYNLCTLHTKSVKEQLNTVQYNFNAVQFVLLIAAFYKIVDKKTKILMIELILCHKLNFSTCCKDIGIVQIWICGKNSIHEKIEMDDNEKIKIKCRLALESNRVYRL